MKRFLVTMVFVAMSLAAISAFAAETTFEGRIYSSWSMGLSEGYENLDGQVVDLKGWNEFSLDRSYVTVKSKLSDYTSLNITTDLRKTSGYDGYAIVLKFGFADWKLNFAPDLVTLRLGLQPTKYLEAMDSQMWNRRYILNSIGDLNGFLTTSDLGANLNFNLGEKAKYGWAGVSIFNGTKYNDLTENNKNKDLNFYVVAKPLVNSSDFKESMLAAQFYTGTQNEVIDTTMEASDYKRQIISFGGNLAYKGMFNVGADIWMNTLGQGPDSSDMKQQAMSFFGALYLKDLVGEESPLRTIDLFGRYDMYDPNTDADNDGDNWMIFGVECMPIKGVAASVNYRSHGFQNENLDSENYLYLNTEFRF